MKGGGRTGRTLTACGRAVGSATVGRLKRTSQEVEGRRSRYVYEGYRGGSREEPPSVNRYWWKK